MMDNKEKIHKEIDDLILEDLEYERRINKALEIIELVKPELWNIDNKMTYRLIDIKNVLLGKDKNDNEDTR